MISWHRFYDPETGRYITVDPIGLDGGMNLYTYTGADPINWIDTNGLSATDVFSGPSTVPILPGIGGTNPSSGREKPGSLKPGIGDLVGVGTAGFSWWMMNEMLSDKELQQEIEKEANRQEYKNICSEQKPPGLTGCELAKWKLNKAIRCKAAREENTRRWWGGEDNRHNPQLQHDLDQAVEDALAEVERLCKCQK